MSSSDAIAYIERATRGFLEEVPALKPLKLVIGVDLVGRGDTQQFRLELPDIKVTKDIAADSRIRVEMRRDVFNVMVEGDAKMIHWRAAVIDGKLKASGVDQYLRLISQVVEKQVERNRTRRSKT